MHLASKVCRFWWALYLSRRLEDVETADEFYSTMGLLIQDVMTGNVIDCQTLMQVSCKSFIFTLQRRAYLLCWRRLFSFIYFHFDDRRKIYSFNQFCFVCICEKRMWYRHKISKVKTYINLFLFMRTKRTLPSVFPLGCLASQSPRYGIFILTVKRFNRYLDRVIDHFVTLYSYFLQR